ncbi:MAG: IclR family transcriptional regulator [Bacillota bacterium]
MTGTKKPNNLVKSVDKTLNILEKLVQSENSLGVTEISNSLGLHKSTVHRLLSTLEYRGYVKKDKNNRYSVGIKLLEIGSKSLNKSDIRNEIKPYLEELKNETKETIHLGILDNYEVIYIDKVESPKTIRMYSSIGKRAPVHCTGLGKCLIAFSNQNYIDDFLQNTNLKKYTQNTITEKGKFRQHLSIIREQGYSIDNEEHETDIRCISGPIFNHKGAIIAAFSISGPANRMTLERIKKLKSLVLNYSKNISAVFGFNP